MTNTVKKPWGCEYILYQNDDVAIWHLFINPYQQTSLHSHPNKKTGLLVLDGAAKVSFLGSNNKLFYSEKIMIRQGVFHQTTCMTSGVLQLLEIETPVNKEDIVRLEDSYGRAGSVYMGDSGDYVKQIDLENDNIGPCNIFYTDLTSDLQFKNFMITEGSITHMDYEVAGPGDILNYGNMHKLLDKFDLVKTIKGIAVC
jgi:mannose-6-phosphate isomerase-like protein (cupin superfamily)|tara:strand:- start:4061 stop:4657 length:597 start_codon:yes stop_codon:yes gene_type:complete